MRGAWANHRTTTRGHNVNFEKYHGRDSSPSQSYPVIRSPVFDVQKPLAKNETDFVCFRCASSAAAPAEAEAKRQKKPKKATKSESYVMNLFRGELVTSQLFPYPDVLTTDQRDTVASMVDPVHKLFTVGRLWLEI